MLSDEQQELINAGHCPACRVAPIGGELAGCHVHALIGTLINNRDTTIAQALSDGAVQVWRAVLDDLDRDGVVIHRDCPRDRPTECDLYLLIAATLNPNGAV
jgi:hypothetical protein